MDWSRIEGTGGGFTIQGEGKLLEFCKGGMGDRAVQGVEWVQRVRGEAQPGGWVCRAG